MKIQNLIDLSGHPELLQRCIHFFGHPYNARYKDNSAVGSIHQEKEIDGKTSVFDSLFQSRTGKVVGYPTLIKLSCVDACVQLSNPPMISEKSYHTFPEYMKIVNRRRKGMGCPLLSRIQVDTARKVLQKLSLSQPSLN